MKKLLLAIAAAAGAIAQVNPSLNPQSGAFLTPLAAAGTVQGVAGTATAITYTIWGREFTAGGVATDKVLAQGQLAASAAALYTVPASTTAYIAAMDFANATGSQVTGVIVFINGTAAANQLIPSITIPAGGSLHWSGGHFDVHDSAGNVFTSGPAFATPAIALGTAAAAGSSLNTMRSDATILAFDATVPAVTTPLALSAVGAATVAARRDHTHQSPGGVAAITTASGAINSTETKIVSATIPANLVAAGTTFRITAWGTSTSTVANTCNFRIRWGSAGNSSDTQLVDLTTTAATSGTAVPFMVMFEVTFQSTTVAEVSGYLLNNGVTGTSNAAVVIVTPANTTGLTTTSNEVIQFSYQTTTNATTTNTFQVAQIQIVKM